MKPDKTTLKRILKHARAIHREQEKADTLFRAYFQQVSPTQHPPFIEKDTVYGYLKAIEDIYGKEISGSVSYWVYEVPDLARGGKVECEDRNGNIYDAGNLESYVNFVLSE